ncbi:hypothetical protein ACFL6C_03780 [Myxococcota bacterium]
MTSVGAKPKGHGRVPSVLLTGDAEAAYVRQVLAVLRAARLNNYYPDARRMSSHIRCLAPEIHQGLYPGVQIDTRSGLPTYREWTRVQTDCSIAAEALADIGQRPDLERRARSKPRSIYGKQLLKHHYYSVLVGQKTAPSSEIDVALRRVEPGANTAYFHVVLDKLDVSGVFVRYTIDLGQQASVWNRPMVTLTEDTAGHTEELRGLIYQFTSFDSEFMFAKLVSVGGLKVERVVKGTIGPFFFGGMRAPVPLQPILEQDGVFVATFSLDMAACDLASDRDNDPIDDLMVESLTEGARQTYHQARDRYGYKVFKDRKFVVPRYVADAVRAFCDASGTRNIVYAVRP